MSPPRLRPSPPAHVCPRKDAPQQFCKPRDAFSLPAAVFPPKEPPQKLWEPPDALSPAAPQARLRWPHLYSRDDVRRGPSLLARPQQLPAPDPLLQKPLSRFSFPPPPAPAWRVP